MPCTRLLACSLCDILAISDRNVWVAGDQVVDGLASSARPGALDRHSLDEAGQRPARWAGRLAPGPHGGVLLTATPAGAVRDAD